MIEKETHFIDRLKFDYGHVLIVLRLLIATLSWRLFHGLHTCEVVNYSTARL